MKLMINPNNKLVNNKETLWKIANKLIEEFCETNSISKSLMRIDNDMVHIMAVEN